MHGGLACVSSDLAMTLSCSSCVDHMYACIYAHGVCVCVCACARMCVFAHVCVFGTLSAKSELRAGSGQLSLATLAVLADAPHSAVGADEGSPAVLADAPSADAPDSS